MPDHNKRVGQHFQEYRPANRGLCCQLPKIGQSLECAVLPCIAQICAEALVSEEYSIYPGVLNPCGPGPELFGMFCWATDKMVEIEFLGPDFAKNKRIELMSLIDFRYMLRDIDIKKDISKDEKQAILRLINIIIGRTPEGEAVISGELGKDAQDAFVWIRVYLLLPSAEVNEQLDSYMQKERHGELSRESALKQFFLIVFGGMLKTKQGMRRITEAINLASRGAGSVRAYMQMAVSVVCQVVRL